MIINLKKSKLFTKMYLLNKSLKFHNHLEREITYLSINYGFLGADTGQSFVNVIKLN